MTITREHKKWKLDQNRWLSENKKWKGANKRVLTALRNLEKLVKRHNQEVKAFEKKSKAYKNLMLNSRHSESMHKTLKKVHLKQNRNHAQQAKSRDNILKITKAIETTLQRM